MIHMKILLFFAICIAWYWIGYFTNWFLTKRAGVIHIEKNKDPEEYDRFAIEFTQDLETLYSQKEVLFKVDVMERIENSPNNDNT